MKNNSLAKKAIKRLAKNPRVWFGVSVLMFAIFVALFAPYISPFDPEIMDDITKRLLPPSLEHLFGNDLTGGDVLTSVIYGTRTSLYIGFITVFISMTFGVGVGLLAGYRKGLTDMLLMRFVDLLMAFPGILLAMALSALMGPSQHNVVLAIAATGWTSSARLVRGQVLSLTEREYVTACHALGASGWRIVIRHIFPGTLSPLVVLATFSLSGVIIIEASLSFLGLGAQDGAPSWGAILSQGRTQLVEAPHMSVAPGIAIFVLVLALNFLGDALRDALDPHQNSDI
jgi:peptide/nickel transport system permease protein